MRIEEEMFGVAGTNPYPTLGYDSEHPDRREAQIECDRRLSRGEVGVEVIELAYCPSCGQEAGLIPVGWLDNWGCMRGQCMH